MKKGYQGKREVLGTECLQKKTKWIQSDYPKNLTEIMDTSQRPLM